MNFSVSDDGVTLSPTAARKEKIQAQIRTAIDEDSLSPDAAAKLAGRVSFLTQAGQSSDQVHLCQGGRHGGLVGGLALDRPRGGSAIAG